MPLIPALRRQKQVNLCEFETSLIYKVSCRTGSKATLGKPVSENKTKQRETENETNKWNKLCLG